MVNIATPFKLNNDEWDPIISEYNVLFRHERNSQEKLLEFAEEYPDKRINIETNKIDVSFLSVLNKAHDNIYIRLTDISDFQYVEVFKEKGIKFFFDVKCLPANSIASLDYLLSLGVSDVYLADDLLYDLRETHLFTSSHNVGIRIVLNTVMANVPYTDQAKTPWFPPDTFHIIEKYISTVEFDCGRPFNWNAFGVYYRAWFDRKDWHGNLNEIILGLDIDVLNDSIVGEDLIRYKIHCRHHCTNAKSHCRKCDQFVELSQKLASKNIGFNKKQVESQ